MSWSKSPERSIDEIMKAGQFTKILKDRNVMDYDSSKKEKYFLQNKLDQVLDLSTICSRADAK